MMRGNWVQTVRLEPPSLADNTADADRLLNVLSKKLNTEQIEADLSLIGKLPDILRKNKYSIRCILFKDRTVWRLAGVTGLNAEIPVAGLAVDLGTTRVVIRLVNLESRRIIDEFAFDNPQIEVGADILTRIHYTDRDRGLEHLNRLIISGLNNSIKSICKRNDILTDHIYLMALAGNTAMTHLFLNLSPRWIIREPYIPVVNTPGVINAEDLGLNINQHAKVFIFPNVGSYFGGDLISGILYSGLAGKTETAMLVDVGTNAEVVLGNKNWLVACAGAAGPALEGGVAKMGMKADPGVIDRITVNEGGSRFDIHTIDDKPPKGICGSGLIDLAAQLFQRGFIDIRGKFNKADGHIKIKEKDGMMHLVVVPAGESATGEDLTISQADLDGLVRSKAAMYTILETITAFVGVDMRKLKEFYIAGTFGIFIRPESAITIGMMPDLPLENYTPIGNSSLGGATMILESSQYAEEITRIRDRITYMELNVNQEFMNRFNAAKFFPHTDTSLFPSVKIYHP
jgi:uncharacterized 2Fe-2S/4Fe-4S cluster protein (DUF4445 family)